MGEVLPLLGLVSRRRRRHVFYLIGLYSRNRRKNDAGRKPSSLCKPHGSKLIYIPVYILDNGKVTFL